jgi:esterase/lipase
MASSHEKRIESNVPFNQYISRCRELIQARRIDLNNRSESADWIINANTPFELLPADTNKIKYGVLLIHGLFDSPYTMRDIAANLAQHHILSRSILLPGHGTKPGDLMHTSYRDWLSTVQYGIDSLRKDVDRIILVGFSTGATLSIHQALNDASIAGIILLAPALKIRAPVNAIIQSYQFGNWLAGRKEWVNKTDENNAVKYQSVVTRAIAELGVLMREIRLDSQNKQLLCPTLLIASREDETISTRTAINYFQKKCNEDSKILLFTTRNEVPNDSRIEIRQFQPSLNIRHISHLSLPHAPENAYYGSQGSYDYASRELTNGNETKIYGAYNHAEIDLYHALYRLGLMRKQYQTLSYNPDFNYMMKSMISFIATLD